MSKNKTMLSFNYSVNAFLFPLDAYYTGKHKEDESLSMLVKTIEPLIRQFINSEKPVKTFADQHLDMLFDFRMSSLKWVIGRHTQRHVPFDEWIDLNWTSLKSDPHYAILYENIAFAIRTSMRSANSVINPDKLTERNLSTLSNLPKLSFTDFLNLISLTAPDAISTSYVDWLVASLHIEFAIVSTFIIQQKKLPITVQKINELAAFIASAAQDFGAIAREMTPHKRDKRKTYPLIPVSDDFLSEQQLLAEQGLELFENR